LDHQKLNLKSILSLDTDTRKNLELPLIPIEPFGSHSMEPQTTKRRKLDTTAEMPQTSDYSNPSVPMGAAATQNPAATMKSYKSSSAAAPFAGDAYNSSLFKLQVEEMLVEVKPNYAKRLGPVGNVLRKLKTLIEAIPDREEMPVSNCASFEIQYHVLNCYVVS
jgi:U3 small nucleolar RNA-associated protein 22